MRNLFKIVTIFFIPLIFFLIFEIILHLVGFRATYENEDPFLGFQSSLTLFEKKHKENSTQEIYSTRQSKLEWFNYQEFLARKPDNGYRVFCFGGSTTYGRPYLYKTAFSNWLQVLLTELLPNKYIEVINVGGVSYASYRIVNLMQEMVTYEPDLFIVYSGHNEFLEERTYSDLKYTPKAVQKLRTNLNRLRTYSLVRKFWLDAQRKKTAQTQKKFQMTGEVKPILDQTSGLDRYRRDLIHKDAILNHYQLNLQRMISMAGEKGIRILFVVPPANIKDFSPFKSELSESLNIADKQKWHQLYHDGRLKLNQNQFHEAQKFFMEANTIDSTFADLKYRQGKCLFATGDFANAKHEFTKATDLDVAPLRATTEIQTIVRKICREKNIPCLDLVKILEYQCQEQYHHSILGREFFLDHAHPTIAVHQTIAENLAQLLIHNELIEPGVSLTEINKKALYDSVFATVDSVYYAIRDLNLAKVLDWAGKHEEAVPFIFKAAESLPDHPEALFMRGLELLNSGKYELAATDLKKAISIDTTYYKAYNALGTVYERTDILNEAVRCFEASIYYAPEYDNAYFNLGNTYYRQGKFQEAIYSFKKALMLNSQNAKALNNLGVVYLTLKNFDLARSAFVETLKLNPQNFKACSNLGVIYYQEGNVPKAIDMFNKALSINSADNFSKSWIDKIKNETSDK